MHMSHPSINGFTFVFTAVESVLIFVLPNAVQYGNRLANDCDGASIRTSNSTAWPAIAIDLHLASCMNQRVGRSAKPQCSSTKITAAACLMQIHRFGVNWTRSGLRTGRPRRAIALAIDAYA